MNDPNLRSQSLLACLWRGRDRDFASLSPEWIKAWGKRLWMIRMLLRQTMVTQALRARGATIGNRCFFSDEKQISGAIESLIVGDESFIGRAEVSVHAPITIGSRVCINDGAKILTASHDIRHPAWPTIARPIVIEDYAWIATNAIILPGVTIGLGAVVAAGAVVSRDVPKGAIAVGNPASLRENQRAEGLNYSPVSHLALFTAWRRL